MINSLRYNLVEEYMGKYFKDGMDAKCIGRVCNREGCEVAWDNQVTIRYLTARLADRVGCNERINTDALVFIAAAISGFYQGAKEAIQSVSFV